MFLQILMQRLDVGMMAVAHAKAFIKHLNASSLNQSDLCELSQSAFSYQGLIAEETELPADNWKDAHLIFLSHYKAEAGTEATLMQEHLERLLRDSPAEF